MIKKVIIHRKTGKLVATGYFIVITSHQRFIKFTDCQSKQTKSMTMREFEKKYRFDEWDI